MTSSTEWQRVRRDHPCPICGRPDWCLVAPDGGAALCARLESSKRCGEAGWLHRLRDEPFRPGRRVVRSIALSAAEPRHDLANLAEQFREAVDHVRLCQFADSLSLSLTTLCQLGIGWSTTHRAWTFPMRDVDGRVVGIRLRRPGGFKFSVKGGKEGLFIPTGEQSDSSPLLVAEGVTDTVALLDLGFVNVVGRPSCTGGVKLLVKLVRERRTPEVVIVADADTAGRQGAGNLASVLVAYTRSVRVIEPPEGIKDVRDWLRAGASHRDIDKAIGATAARRLVIRAVTVGKGCRS